MANTDHHKAIADETATKCIEEVKQAATEDEPMANADGMDCSKLAMKGFFCAGEEFLKSCPVESQDTSEKCVKFRKALDGGHLKKAFAPMAGFQQPPTF